MRLCPNISLSAISCVNFGISFLEAETTNCCTTQEGFSAEIWVIAASFRFYFLQQRGISAIRFHLYRIYRSRAGFSAWTDQIMNLCFQVQILNIAAKIKTTIFYCPVFFVCLFFCKLFQSTACSFLFSAASGHFQCSLLLQSWTRCVCKDGQGAAIRVDILSFQTTRSCPSAFDLWL